MWVLLLFEWKIMEHTYSAQPKTLLHIAPLPQAALQAERPSDPARLPAGRRGSDGGGQVPVGRSHTEFLRFQGS